MPNESIDTATGEVIEAVDPLTRAIQDELEQVQLFGTKTTYHILRAGQMLNQKYTDMASGRKSGKPPHGMWYAYISDNLSGLGCDPRIANRMMNAAREFSPDPRISDYIDVSAAYVLGSPSVPPEALDEAKAMIAKKKLVSHAIAKDLIKSHKEPPEPKPDTSGFQSRLNDARSILNELIETTPDELRGMVAQVIREYLEELEQVK